MGRIQDLKQAVQEVGTSYLDPLVNRDLMTLEELKYKLKNKEIGKKWYEQEVRKLKALSKVANITGSAAWDAVPSDAQEIIKSGLQHTGKFLGSTGQVLGEAWQGARTVENWKDPGDVLAAGTARTIESGLELASWVPKGLIWGSHNILRMHKPVANITGTAASFYVTPGRVVSSSYKLLNAAAKNHMVLNTAARLNQTRFMNKTGNLYQRLMNVPADKRIVNIKNMRGNQLPPEGRTSAFLKEGGMFKSGGAAQERAIDQRRFLRAQEGDPTAGILLYDSTSKIGKIKDSLVNPNKPWTLKKTDKTQFEDVLTEWSRDRALVLEEQGLNPGQIIKTIKKELTDETKAGIFIANKRHRIGQSNMYDVLYEGDTIKVKDATSADARYYSEHPEFDPEVQNFFKARVLLGKLPRTMEVYHGRIGNEKLKELPILEAYGHDIKKLAKFKDDQTVNMAKLFGWDKAYGHTLDDYVLHLMGLDKEHAWALGAKGSNDWLSQFYGSQMLNRSQGKLNSFTRETMRILGAPTTNLESASNWAAQKMADLTNKPYYNPAVTLQNSDWLRIQEAFGKLPAGATKHMQEEVAMKVLRQRELINEWVELGLHKVKPKSGNSDDIIIKFIEKINQLDVHISKGLLERTIGNEAYKKITKLKYKTVKGQLVLDENKQPIRDKLFPHEGPTVSPPGAALDKDTGRQKGSRKPIGKITPTETVTNLDRNLSDQNFYYVESILDKLDEMDTTRNPFGLSEMQDKF